MALRDKVTKWHAAICLIEGHQMREAVAKLLEIDKPEAKIIYNLGCICMLQQEYNEAIQYFNKSTEQDKYLVIAYYQRGFCYHEVQRYDRAELDFLTAQSIVHNDCIDYKQLGAQVILTPQMLEQCVAITRDSHHTKQHLHLPTPLPLMSCIFRPPKKVVENLVKQDFLGRAKVISSTQQDDILYAEGKRQSKQSDTTSNQSTSLPTSPFSPRRHPDATGATKLLIPPPPRRPPPRLFKGTLEVQDLRAKSKSCENILASENHYEDIDDDPGAQFAPRISPENRRQTAANTTSLRPKTLTSSTNTSSSCSNAKSIQETPVKILPQHQHNQGRSFQSSRQVGGLGSELDKPVPRPRSIDLESRESHAGFQMKGEDFNTEGGKSVLRRIPPGVFGAASNQQGPSGQGQDRAQNQQCYRESHTARMRALFERGDSFNKNSEIKPRHMKTVREDNPAHNGMTKDVTQTSLVPSLHSNIASPKSPKPARPPPPKIVK